jgi:hypothetical protein
MLWQPLCPSHHAPASAPQICARPALLASAARAAPRSPQVGRDSRPYMRAAYEAFRDGLGADSIAAAAGPDPDAGPSFYAWMYVGLYHEAHGDAASAKEAMLRCVHLGASGGTPATAGCLYAGVGAWEGGGAAGGGAVGQVGLLKRSH